MGPKGTTRNRPAAAVVPVQRINYRPPVPSSVQAAPAQRVKRNPTFTEKDKHEPTYNILTCLACIQQREIDLVGISPLEVQGQLGQGGQAVVTQTRASIDTVLAFKRPNSKGVGSWLSTRSLSKRIENVYRDVATEIMALSEPGIRDHPNIIQLQAISWEIQNIRTWTFKKVPRVWPVLLMKRAEHGDLQDYMATKEGSDLSFEDMMELCHGIASAVAAAHGKGIVHGDIKPRNVLVFKENNKATVKLADFGFSAFASSKNLTLGGTVPWMAPEVQSRGSHTLSQAKQTDMFSFGLLVLWILFRKQLQEKGRSMQSADPRANSGGVLAVTRRLIRRVTDWIGGPQIETSPDIRYLMSLNTLKESSNSVRTVALQLIKDNIADNPRWKKSLTDLLGQILQFDHTSRGNDAEFERIKGVFSGQSLGAAENSVSRGGSVARFPPPSSFKLSKSLQTICHADFRVRIFIFDTLSRQYQAERKKKPRDNITLKKIAFQLAFCYKIGFGTKPSPKKVKDLLKARGIPPEDLESEITNSRIYRGLRKSRLLQEMERKGVMQPVHHTGSDFDISSSRQGEDPVTYRTHEVEEMEKALGPTHPAVLNLKWSLSSFDDTAENLEMLHKMVKDLEQEDQREQHVPTGECRQCREIAMTKSYRLLALMPLLGPHTTIEFAAFAEKTERELRILNDDEKDGEHMAVLMVCVALSDIFAAWGRLAESEPYLTRAILGTKAMFGEDHPNTVFLREKEARRLMGEGQFDRAADLMEEAIKKLGTLVHADNIMVMGLREKLVFMSLMRRKYERAEEIIEEMAKLADGRIPGWHPAVVLPPLNVAMAKKEFEKAVGIARAGLGDAMRMAGGGGMPGLSSPGLPNDPRHEEPPAAAKELLGEECFFGQVQHSTEGPQTSVLSSMQTWLIIALHALAWSEETAGNSGKANVLKKEAETHLNLVLQHIHQVFGDASWDDLSGRSGIGGSALWRAMDEEHTQSLEALLALGDNGMRDDIHYKWTIAQAEDLGYSKLQKLLEEHRVICKAEPPVLSAGQSPDFSEAAELAGWIAGHWAGAFLYGSGGMRRDPKGRCTLKLEAGVRGRGKDAEVILTGTVQDDLGDRIASGTATLSGRIDIRIRFPHVKEEAGWHYRGAMNRARGAIGGIWGMPDPDRESAGGTFFFYKDDTSNS